MKKVLRVALMVVGGLVAVLLVGGIISAVTGPDEQGQNTTSPEPSAAVEGSGGIPPEPAPEVVAQYISALEGISQDIVHGKIDKAVDRGRNQCSSVKSFPNDEAKLIELTRRRFTSPNNPEGFGWDTSKNILSVVEAFLCPSYR